MERITDRLLPILEGVDVCIVHNVFTLHKNLPLTVALARMAEHKMGPKRWIAWCHDLAWNNPLYANDLLPRWPWTPLKYPLPNVNYVAISERRRVELSGLFRVPLTGIALVPNGIDPASYIPTSPAMARLRGLLRWDETFLDGSFAPAKKGASPSAKPSAARARSGWYWRTVKVFRWEFGWKVPLRQKLRLRKPHSKKSASRNRKAGRGKSRSG